MCAFRGASDSKPKRHQISVFSLDISSLPPGRVGRNWRQSMGALALSGLSYGVFAFLNVGSTFSAIYKGIPWYHCLQNVSSHVILAFSQPMWGVPLPPPKRVQIQHFFKGNLHRKLSLFFSDIGGKFICPKPWSYQSKCINLMAFTASYAENHEAINLNA